MGGRRNAWNSSGCENHGWRQCGAKVNNEGNMEIADLKMKEQNKPYRKMGRGRERSEVKSGNVIANGDPPIKTNSYSHQGHDRVFVP